MNHSKPEQKAAKPRILVAPLDWGLGHATRCIPIIRHLLDIGIEVWIASEGAQASILRAEFPNLSILPLKGYRARYASTPAGLLWQMIIQTPRFLQTINKEHSWLQKAVAKYGFNAVISDNRYGLYHAQVPSIFITHQLKIKTPLSRWVEKIIQQRNYSYINKYDECWVPDFASTTNNLAGELSHPLWMPRIPVQYTGPLSRFQQSGMQERKGHILIIISGPEPQRSIFENKIINQLAHYNGTATVVRGLPAESSLIPSSSMLRFYNHLIAAGLNSEIEQAEFVICRSGYSTVMDLAALGKKSIMVPTQGQSEQEYLASYLAAKKMTLNISQQSFNLEDAIAKAKAYNYSILKSESNEQLPAVVQSLLARMKYD